MVKKRYLLLGAVIPLVLLNGCSIGSNKADKTIPIEQLDMSRYAKHTVEGQFKDILNKKFMDVTTGDKTETYLVRDEALNQLTGLKQGNQIRFVYALNATTDQNEIYSITPLNGNRPTQSAQKVSTVQSSENNTENKNKIDLEVKYTEGTKKEKAVPSDFLKGKFDVIDTYQWDRNNLTKNDGTEIQFTYIPDTILNDIERERWRASGILKQYGNIKEENAGDRENAKFIFYTEADNHYKEIMVIKNKYGYFRVETDTDLSKKDNVIAELTAMLNSIE